jgi:hypothetical protein
VYLLSVTDARRRIPKHPELCRIEPDGTFELADVPAGGWDLFLQGWRKTEGQWESRSSNAPVTSLELSAGETTDVVIDGDQLMPAPLTGTCLVDQRPPSGAQSLRLESRPLVVREPGFLHNNVVLLTDTAGAFAAVLEPPACYRLSLMCNTPAFVALLPLTDWFPAVARASVHHDFQVRTGTVRFRLLQADGTTPVPQRLVTFQQANSDGGGRGTTDDDGWIELPQMPAMRMAARTQRWSQDEAKAAGLSAQEQGQATVELETFTVTEGTSVEVVRKLPAQ